MSLNRPKFNKSSLLEIPASLLTLCTHGTQKFPGQGVKQEVQLTATTTATATQDPSHICNHQSSQQCWVSYPLRKARNLTHILMDTSQIHFCCTTMGTPWSLQFKFSFQLLFLHIFFFFFWQWLSPLNSLSPCLLISKIRLGMEFPLWHSRNESDQYP